MTRTDPTAASREELLVQLASMEAWLAEAEVALLDALNNTQGWRDHAQALVQGLYTDLGLTGLVP